MLTVLSYINVTDRRTDRQTDRRTDGRTTYDSNTALALRASRGKNRFAFAKVIIKKTAWVFYFDSQSITIYTI